MGIEPKKIWDADTWAIIDPPLDGENIYANSKKVKKTDYAESDLGEYVDEQYANKFCVLDPIVGVDPVCKIYFAKKIEYRRNLKESEKGKRYKQQRPGKLSFRQRRKHFLKQSNHGRHKYMKWRKT